MALTTGFCPPWTVVCSFVRPFIQQTFTEEQPCAVSVLLQEVVGGGGGGTCCGQHCVQCWGPGGTSRYFVDSAQSCVTWGDLEGGGHGTGKRRPQMAPSLATDASKLTLGPSREATPTPAP